MGQFIAGFLSIPIFFSWFVALMFPYFSLFGPGSDNGKMAIFMMGTICGGFVSAIGVIIMLTLALKK